MVSPGRQETLPFDHEQNTLEDSDQEDATNARCDDSTE